MSACRRVQLWCCGCLLVLGCGLLQFAESVGAQEVRDQAAARPAGGHAEAGFGPGWALAYSPDGKWLAVGGMDCELNIRALDDRSLFRSLAGHESPCACARFSKDGSELLSFGRHVIVWSAKDWTIAREVRPVEAGRFLAVAHELPLAATVPESRDRKAVIIWDHMTGEVVQELKIEGIPLCAAFDSTDFLLAVGLLAETKEKLLGVEIWDLKTQRRIQTIDRLSGSVSSLAFSTDGDRLAIGESWTARVWGVKTGRDVRRFEGHSGVIEAVSFSPDGTLLAAGGDGPIQRTRNGSKLLSELKLWRIEDGRLLKSCAGDLGRTRNVQFSDDGLRVAWTDATSVQVTSPNDFKLEWSALLGGGR